MRNRRQSGDRWRNDPVGGLSASRPVRWRGGRRAAPAGLLGFAVYPGMPAGFHAVATRAGVLLIPLESLA
jgi:hypothetical protein